MEEIILFILSFIFMFIVYQIFIVGPAKNNKKKKKDKEPIEVIYLVSRYKLNLKKINYNQLLQIIALTSSFDIALIGSLIMLVDNFFFRLIIGIVSIIGVIVISYHLVYLFYKKKGMISNE